MPSLASGISQIYKAKKFAILLFFIFYTLVQCAGQFTSSRVEYFPVFSWSLFSEVPRYWSAIEVEILRIDETEFQQPKNFFDLDEYFDHAKGRSSDVVKSAVQLARLHHRNPPEGERMRRTFEESYFSGHDVVEYQLVAVRYDPVLRWRTGEVVRRKVLARFSTEDGQ